MNTEKIKYVIRKLGEVESALLPRGAKYSLHLMIVAALSSPLYPECRISKLIQNNVDNLYIKHQPVPTRKNSPNKYNTILFNEKKQQGIMEKQTKKVVRRSSTKLRKDYRKHQHDDSLFGIINLLQILLQYSSILLFRFESLRAP